MRKMPRPHLVCRTLVPIYQVRLILGVAKNPVELQKHLPPAFRESATGEWEDMEGCCAISENVGVILFKRAPLAHDVIAHEIFHMTHRIMERTGEVFSHEHHEPFAYLNGWMTKWAYRRLKTAGEKIN